MNQQAERRVGTIIGGKWRVDALLGSGSMAAVYAVTHRNGARAALKVLHPTLCMDPAVCERFLGEGYLANSVKHQGIVRVSDDGLTDDGCAFLVMDLLEGGTLEALREKRGGRIPVLELLDIADELMDALGAVHLAGIIHRDLKPQNVFVCHDGTVKLLDFGVARVFDRGAQSKLSMFGLVLGTPSFMSPEQALGSRDKVDHRSDIWSLGATLFTALTGEAVHLGANLQAKLLAAATVKARSISMVMPELTPALASAIDMALRFKKEDRWQSVDAMRRAFRDARLQVVQESIPPASYDPSLDEPTHIDKGKPKFSDTMRSNAEHDFARSPMLIELGVSEQPPATEPHPGAPPRPMMKSMPPPRATLPPFGTAPPPSTAAVARRGPSTADFGASRPDGQDGSIPAFGGSVPSGADDSAGVLRSVGPRHKRSLPLWIGAVLLASALGGLAFFAVKSSAAGRAPNPPAASSTTTLATRPAPTLSLPSTVVTVPAAAPMPARDAPADSTMTVIELPLEPSAEGTAAEAGSRDVTAPQPTPRRRQAPRGGADSPRARPLPDAPPPDRPPPSPELPPDPFGTPE